MSSYGKRYVYHDQLIYMYSSRVNRRYSHVVLRPSPTLSPVCYPFVGDVVSTYGAKDYPFPICDFRQTDFNLNIQLCMIQEMFV